MNVITASPVSLESLKSTCPATSPDIRTPANLAEGLTPRPLAPRPEIELDARQQARIASVPKRYQALYTKCLGGKVTLRLRVKAKCLECMGWEGAKGVGTVQDMILACSSTTCSLFQARPWR